jgi:hypothetical protein
MHVIFVEGNRSADLAGLWIDLDRDVGAVQRRHYLGVETRDRHGCKEISRRIPFYVTACGLGTSTIRVGAECFDI